MSTPRQARCYSCCKGGGLVAPVSADEADQHLRHDVVLHVRFWHISDALAQSSDVRCWGMNRR